jgi:UDP-N-acetyl-D-mannosaminuronic acid transferase (WecB/TagA/CpsF family)
METRKIDILGVGIGCVTYDSALEVVQHLAREPRPTAVCPANTHILAEAATIRISRGPRKTAIGEFN